MAQIHVNQLTYSYEGSFDSVFENATFSIDTNWRLGLIGRNGKGKTTLLRLLTGELQAEGIGAPPTAFDYFPFRLTRAQQSGCAAEWIERVKPDCELWRVICELGKLGMDAQALYRPFSELSHGERTKTLLALLFSGEDRFLLIDEPTNHLDRASRELVKRYLAEKKGFILVSHDRDLLDACVDHVLVLNRKTIEVQRGNFSSWWENKEKKDAFERQENEKHAREIDALKKRADRTSRWAQKSESSKIGFDPIREHDRSIAARSFIGAKTKKLQKRVSQTEQRIEREIEEKKALLQDAEDPAELKLCPLSYHKARLISCREASIGYEGGRGDVLRGLDFELMRGERVFLQGGNGSGKSTLIRAILSGAGMETDAAVRLSQGELRVGSGLVISYVNQDTSFLRGGMKDFCRERGLEETLFFAMLRQLDMERVQFAKPMEALSEGQRKKVLLAASLMTPAHLYIWDEPLNYIDVFSRMQLEELILRVRPTMLLVEHDRRFEEKLATRIVRMGKETDEEIR